MFIGALFTVTKTWNQPRYPSADKWIKKMWQLCTMGYYSAIKKNDTSSLAATWIQPKDLRLSEISHSENYYMISYWWELKCFKRGKLKKNACVYQYCCKYKTLFYTFVKLMIRISLTL